MRTLDHIWKECEKERTLELDCKLCGRLRKLAFIVLKRLHIRPYNPHFDDYMQDAFLLFFELLPTYDPKKGKLEGYFMVSFKHKMYEEMKLRSKEKMEVPLKVDVKGTDTPASTVIVKDLVSKLSDVLTDGERVVLDYLLDGINDIKEIAEKEGTDVNVVKWTLDELQGKARNLFFDGKKEMHGYK